MYSIGVTTADMATCSPKQISGLAGAEPVKSNPVSTCMTCSILLLFEQPSGSPDVLVSCTTKLAIYTPGSS